MWHIGERQRLRAGDRLWLAVSLFWGLGCENALFALMTHAGTVVLQERFEAGEAIDLIEHERCTVVYATREHGARDRRAPRVPARSPGVASHRGHHRYPGAGAPPRRSRCARESATCTGSPRRTATARSPTPNDPIEVRMPSTVGRPLPGFRARHRGSGDAPAAVAPGRSARSRSAATSPAATTGRRTRTARPSTTRVGSSPAISAFSTIRAGSTFAAASRR